MTARWPAEDQVPTERPLKVSCVVLLLGTPSAAGVWVRFGVAWGLVVVLAALLVLALLHLVELHGRELQSVLDDALAEIDAARDEDRMVVLTGREYEALMRAGPR